MSVEFTDHSVAIVAAMKAAGRAAEQALGDDMAKGIEQIAPRLSDRFATHVHAIRVSSLPESENGTVNPTQGGVAVTNEDTGFWGYFQEFGFMHKNGKHVPAQPSFSPMMEFMGPRLAEVAAEELGKVVR